MYVYMNISNIGTYLHKYMYTCLPTCPYICTIHTHICIHAYTYTHVCLPLYLPKHVHS